MSGSRTKTLRKQVRMAVKVGQVHPRDFMWVFRNVKKAYRTHREVFLHRPRLNPPGTKWLKWRHNRKEL